MKKYISLSFLFVAMFTTIATNNAFAQPASFTADFLQEDYRDGEVVRTNTVTVVWDAESQQLTFNNFYWNFDIVNKSTAIVNLPINYGENTTSINWISDTKATFTWRLEFMGFTTKYNWTTYRPYAVVCNMIKSSTYTGKDIYGVNTYYAYQGGSDCCGTIDLEKGEITLDDSWGLVCGYSSEYSVSNREGYKHMNSTTVVEGFDRSVMTIIKTDLVDIVNDGTVGEEYEVYDDLIGVTTVSGVQSSPVDLTANTNSFKISSGKYKLDLDVSDSTRPYTLTISQTTDDVTTSVDNGTYPTYYIIGEVNGNSWNPTVGQPMATADGNHYSAVVNCDGTSEGYNYFSITNVLAQNNDQGGWDYVNNVNNGNHRFGPSSDNYTAALDVLFAKDLGKYKYPSQISEGQIDFLGKVQAECLGNTKLQPVADFDQSNWVMLTGLSEPDNYVGKVINGKSITGKLTDKLNPTIAVTSTPTAGSDSPYEPNIYIMPSFNEAYYASDSRFFFVAPKVQEYAYITWACYNTADGNFYTMSDGNDSELTGGIKVNWDYYPEGNPQDRYVYQFDAIVRKVEPATSSAPQLKDGNQSTPVTGDLSADYLVYPLRLYDVPTAIKTVETVAGKVVDVKYYNMMGVESSTPFTGVNIVVSTYDNGNRTTSKQLFK